MRLKFLSFALIFSLISCTGINTEMEYGDLKILSYSGESVFLETKPKKIFINLNAPKELANLDKNIANKLLNKGIVTAENETEADTIINVNLVDANIDEHIARNISRPLSRGSTTGGSAAAGAGLGYLAKPSASGAVAGAVIGLTGGSLADLTVNY